MITGTAGNITLPAGSSIEIIYDAGSSVWRVTSAGASVSGVGNSFIANNTGLQSSANFNIQSATTTGVTAKLVALASQTADILQTRNSADTATSFSIGNAKSISSVGVGSTPTGVAVQGRYAYVINNSGIAGSSGLSIYDVTSATPVLKGSLTGFTGLTEINVLGKYAYAIDTTSNLFRAFDVSNPALPVSIGSITTTSLPKQLSVVGRYAYVVTNTSPSTGTLQVFDLSNPNSPTSISSLSLVLNSSQGLAVQGNYAYVVGNNGLGSSTIQAINISNPVNPTSVSTFSTGNSFLSVSVSGRYAYVIDSGASFLRVMDVANPASMSQAGSVAITGTPFGSPIIAGQYVYFATSGASNAVQVINVATPTAPVNVGSISSGGLSTGKMAVSGRYAYIFDATTPNLNTIDLGGTYAQALEVGSIESADAQIRGKLTVASSATIVDGLTVSGGFQSYGTVGFGGTFSDTSGTENFIRIAPNFNPTATSTATFVAELLQPVINFSNATPGAGKTTALLINPIYTSAPTGINLLIDAQNGGTSVFNVSRTGDITTAAGATISPAAAASGGALTVSAGSGFVANGGVLSLFGGYGNSNGGGVTIHGGFANLQGGDVNIIGGYDDGSGGGSPNIGGSINLNGATGNTTGGSVTINAGFGGTTNGSINIGSSASSFINIGSTQTGQINLQSSANIVIGTANVVGNLLVLDTKTTSGDPTGIAGGMYYNSFTGSYRCYITGWIDCVGGSISQGGNTFSGATAMTIGTINAGNFNLITGNTTKLSVDNTTGNVTLGVSAVDTVGSLLVVDTKTDAVDPTGVNGGLYYNSSFGKFRCYQNGVWKNCDAAGTATKIVGTSATGGTSGAVPSIGYGSADYVNASTTSAQTVINQALAALGTTGGTVYLMEGTYIVNGSISIPNNTTLMGTGPGTIIKIANGTGTTNVITNTDTSGTGGGIVVQNLKIDGNASNQTSLSHGIHFTNLGDTTTSRMSAKVDNNNIVNFYYSGGVVSVGIYLDTVVNSIITNNTTKLSGNLPGVSINNSSYVTISNNLLNEAPLFGGTANGLSGSGDTYLTIANNSIGAINLTSNSSSVSSNSINAGSGFYGLTLSGYYNLVSSNNCNCTGSGFNITGHYTTVSSNYLYGSFANYGASASITLTNSNIVDNYFFLSYQGVFLNITSSTFSNNIIKNIAHSSLSITSSIDNIISGNDITFAGDTFQSAILADATSTQNDYRDNRIELFCGGSNCNAIQIDGTSNNLESNRYYSQTPGFSARLAIAAGNTLVNQQTNLSSTAREFTDLTTRLSGPSATAFQIQDSGGVVALNISTNNVTASFNAAAATLKVAKDSGTSRSINAAGTINASGADYAEYFVQHVPGSLVEGDLVCLRDDKTVEACSTGGNLIGAVSSNPGFVGNDLFDPAHPENTVLVALMGQVSVKVSASNGAIAAGDHLTLSTTSGVAVKQTSAGKSLGQAMEPLASGDGTILVLINPGYYAPSTSGLLQGSGLEVAGSTLLTGAVSIDGSLNVSGATTINSLTVTTNLVVQQNLTVSGNTTVANLTVNGKLITSGNKPLTAVLGTVINNAQVTVSTGTDTAGNISFVTDTLAPVDGKIRITFATPYTTAPVVNLTAAGKDAAQLGAYIESTSATEVVIGFVNAPQALSTYNFNYQIIQAISTN
jgi:hypothetical protein